MFQNAIRGIVILAAVAGVVGSGEAGVRSFSAPSMFGDRIAFCSGEKGACGKSQADKWCTQLGFEKALRFQRDHFSSDNAKGKNIVARVAGSGDIYIGNNPILFRNIKCYSTK